MWASHGRLEPSEYDLKEYWTWRHPGRPVWFVRHIRRLLGQPDIRDGDGNDSEGSRGRGPAGDDYDDDEHCVGDGASKDGLRRAAAAAGAVADDMEYGPDGGGGGGAHSRPVSAENKEHLSDVAVMALPRDHHVIGSMTTPTSMAPSATAHTENPMNGPGTATNVGTGTPQGPTRAVGHYQPPRPPHNHDEW